MRQKKCDSACTKVLFHILNQEVKNFLEKFDEKIEQKLKDSEHKYSEPLEEAKDSTKEANQFIHEQLTGNQ